MMTNNYYAYFMTFRPLQPLIVRNKECHILGYVFKCFRFYKQNQAGFFHDVDGIVIWAEYFDAIYRW